jgi:hypothetical protein
MAFLRGARRIGDQPAYALPAQWSSLERNQNNRALGETLEDGFFLRKNPLEGRVPGYIYSGSAIACGKSPNEPEYIPPGALPKKLKKRPSCPKSRAAAQKAGAQPKNVSGQVHQSLDRGRSKC